MGIENMVADSFPHGDQRALRTIYDRYGGVVLHFTTRLLGDGPDVAGVVRDTFVAAWAGRATYQPDSGCVLRWLLSIAWRASTDALRLAESGRAGEDVVARRDPALADAVALRMIDEIVVADELARLSQERRRCLHLAFAEKQTVEQISDLTGLRQDAVRTHLRQGIATLRRRLEVDGATPAPGSHD